VGSNLDEVALPACGIYRTTRTLHLGEHEVPANQLVYFHNHSDAGPPLLLAPASNENNKWTFQERGHSIVDSEDIGALASLKPEGFYRFREHFHPNEDQIVAANATVQLGYDLAASPLVFFPTVYLADNSLRFPSNGMKIDDKLYELLEPLDVRGPFVPKVRHLH